jgi:hypothetical protein
VQPQCKELDSEPIQQIDPKTTFSVDAAFDKSVTQQNYHRGWSTSPRAATRWRWCPRFSGPGFFSDSKHDARDSASSCALRGASVLAVRLAVIELRVADSGLHLLTGAGRFCLNACPARSALGRGLFAVLARPLLFCWVVRTPPARPPRAPCQHWQTADRTLAGSASSEAGSQFPWRFGSRRCDKDAHFCARRAERRWGVELCC